MLARLSVVICLLTAATAASAQQATVRVTRNQATIWQRNLVTVITVVPAGTELEVVGRTGNWIEVVLPPSEGGRRRTGFIGLSQVVVESGTLPRDGTASRAIGSSTMQAARPRVRRPPPPRRTGVRAFGDVGYSFFTAHNTFKAIIGQPASPFIGGGADFRLQDRLFVQGSVRWLRRTGERVIVEDDEVFTLGLDDTITIVPLAVTAGYRFHRAGVVPYVGGGVGQYRFRETSDFSVPGDDVSRRFTSYHFLAGFEWRGSGWAGGAFEVQYTLVPDALDSPVAAAYDEHDLGGIEARVKFLIGR
jgi:hypothetical protein